MAAKERIPVARPLFGEEEIEAIRAVLASGWVMQGPRVAQLEERLARLVGTRHAIACSSGTAGLHLALLALGIGPRDEVVVPALGYVATAHAVEMCGARPLFVDVNPRTWALDGDACADVQTPRTRALIAVDLFGQPADLDAVRGLGVPIIEDAAGALGAVHGVAVEAAVFSFHPRKLITMGEGGAVCTDRDDLAVRMWSARNQGRAAVAGAESLEDYAGPGVNARLTDLQAAVGLCQLDRFDEMLARRRRLVARYRELLADLPLELPPDSPAHAYQAFVVLVERRAEVIAALAGMGVDSVPGAHAIPALPYYRSRYDLPIEAFPHAMAVHERSLALPLYPQMTDAEQDRVVEAVGVALRQD